jgi:hypothetical protein
MTHKTELLPCPFCGGKPIKRISHGDERNAYANTASISCEKCGCTRSAAGDTSKRGYADNSTIDVRAIEAWNTRALPDVRAAAPAIDFNEEIILPCPPDVRPLFCGDIKLSFDGAEYRGRVWITDPDADEMIAIEGPENCRKAGEALIAWAEAWESKP